MQESSEVHTKVSAHRESKCAFQIWVGWVHRNRSVRGTQRTGQDSTLPGAWQVWMLLEQPGAVLGHIQASPQHHLHHTPGQEGLLIQSQISNEDKTFFRNASTEAHATGLEPLPAQSGSVCSGTQLPPSSAQDARNNPAPFPLLPTASV